MLSDVVPKIPLSFTPDALGTSHEPACAFCGGCERDVRIQRPDLERFVTDVMEKHGVARHEGEIVSRVLVASDLRGIPSHGVARLSRYLSGIEKGHIVPGVEPEILEPSPAVAVIDARNGLGQVVSEQAMDLAMAKARANGVGVVTVKHSNHYGIAGYYAIKAVKQDLIGVSMTNAAPLVVPTFGTEMILGTNPIAFGAPCNRHPAFLLDMATSVVPRGKLEVYDRRGKQMPMGWALDEQGFDCPNPGQVLKNMIARAGGGILPLGGRGEEFSGYKGFGMALMVDILCGVLSGAAYGPYVDDVHRPSKDGQPPMPDVGHFFLAIDIARFLPLADFKARMDDYLDLIQSSRKSLDQERIFIHGEKEWEKAACHEVSGVPLSRSVADALEKTARNCGVPWPA